MEKYLTRAIEIVDRGEIIDSIKEYKTCLRRLNFKERVELDEYLIKRFEPEYYNKIKTDLNFRAKVIASYVRLNMEDFHCENLSDKQMKELNPLIRNAIYTALCDLERGGIMRTHLVQRLNLAPYWEDCEYMKEV